MITANEIDVDAQRNDVAAKAIDLDAKAIGIDATLAAEESRFLFFSLINVVFHWLVV